MNASAAPDPHAREQHGDPTATLVIRAWRDPASGTLRARIVEAGPTPPPTWATAEGVSAICEAVRTWLTNRAPPP